MVGIQTASAPAQPVTVEWSPLEERRVTFIPHRCYRSPFGALYTNCPSGGLLVRFDDGALYYLSAADAVRSLARSRHVGAEPPHRRARRVSPLWLVLAGMALGLLLLRGLLYYQHAAARSCAGSEAAQPLTPCVKLPLAEGV